MELLSPAGNFEKLRYAFIYGADAAYIGLKDFSLRAKADNFDFASDAQKMAALKKEFPQKKIYCAANISFCNEDLRHLRQRLDEIAQFPFDAFIVQDLGASEILRSRFPEIPQHLSTQANCLNFLAAKAFQKMGFSRIVLGREASIAEIAEIKSACPDLELEVFVHGAMCLAYSGRCFLSAWTAGRSANRGECAHVCRWNWRVLEEGERQGEFFPVVEDEKWTQILSPKDLCMIGHLRDLKDAGADSLKIEGRMKSLYYVAMTARAYRKALDALDGKIGEEAAAPFEADLKNVSSREWTTAFFYNRADANETTDGKPKSPFLLAGTVEGALDENQFLAAAENSQKDFEKSLSALHPKRREIERQKAPRFVEKKEGWNFFDFRPLNKIDESAVLQFVAPQIPFLECKNFLLVAPETGEILPFAAEGSPCALYTDLPLQKNFIARQKA